jgi:type II secretory pathway pseudopilin PulG
MRWPRLRLSLKTSMILVAVAALILAGFVMQRRRNERLQRAAFWTQLEANFGTQYDHAKAEASAAHTQGDRDPWGDAGMGSLRDHATRMRRKWERDASRPWKTTVEADEPQPPVMSEVRLFNPPDLPSPLETKRP